jgi:hypothetical protein
VLLGAPAALDRAALVEQMAKGWKVAVQPAVK